MTNKQKQLQLKHLGYYLGEIDGLLGPLFKKGTGLFQEAYNLEIDQSFGPKTEAKSIEVWKDIQTKLKARGCYDGKIDGYVGNLTINGIVRFQKSVGLVPDASCGPLTLAKLNETPCLEKAIFGMETLRITQGYNNNYSHKGRLALDIAGRDGGQEWFKAPFDGYIKRIYTTSGNVVWLESKDKVKYADGTEDYMTIMLIHMNNVSSLKVGQFIKKGTAFYLEGTSGNATGNHIHLEVGKGKFTGTGWYKNKYGKWCINNSIEVHKALFLPKNCNIINGFGYDWKFE
jgi:murein DD-endopeptidase MepM/ murein hydrolase activator NlpD